MSKFPRVENACILLLSVKVVILYIGGITEMIEKHTEVYMKRQLNVME